MHPYSGTPELRRQTVQAAELIPIMNLNQSVRTTCPHNAAILTCFLVHVIIKKNTSSKKRSAEAIAHIGRENREHALLACAFYFFGIPSISRISPGVKYKDRLQRVLLLLIFFLINI